MVVDGNICDVVLAVRMVADEHIVDAFVAVRMVFDENMKQPCKHRDSTHEDMNQ
jgi:hypothetical protein